MNRFLAQTRRVVLFFIALTAPVTSAYAEIEPVLVVSVASSDRMMKAVQALTATAGAPEFGQLAAMISQPYFRGLDTSRPLGLVVTAEGDELVPFGFLPVTDLQLFLSTFEPQLGKPEEVESDIWKLSGRATMYCKQEGTWAFIAPSIDALRYLPKEPEKLLQELPHEYHVALRAFVQRVPESLRQMALDKWQQRLEQEASSTDSDGALRQQLAQNQQAHWQALMNELDQVTCGWAVDANQRQTHFDLALSAMPGTDTARQLSSLTKTNSDFASLLDPRAMFLMNGAMDLGKEEIRQAVDLLELARSRAKAEIEKDENLREETGRQLVSEVVDGLFDVVEDTVKAGRADSAVAVHWARQNSALIAAARIADGRDLEETLRKFVQLGETEPGFPTVQWNVAQQGEVRFHTARLPLPAGKGPAQVLGASVEIAVGIGPQQAYIGVGPNGLAHLQQAVAQCAQPGPVEPYQVRIAVGQVLQFFNALQPNPILEDVTRQLGPAKNRDHIVVHALSTDDQMRYRVVIEEGALMAGGQVGRAASGARQQTVPTKQGRRAVKPRSK